MLHSGQVVTYNREKKFGFIEDWNESSKQFFFHRNSVTGGLDLQPYDFVTFELAPSTRKPGTQHCVGIVLRKRDEAPSVSVIEVQS